MRLYSGSSSQFIDDAIHNQIAEKLRLAFFNYFRFYPPPSELNSWRNSLRAISQVFQYSNLLDHGVMLEYQLPLTSKRLDCMICGRDQKSKDNAVIVELKQWDKCKEAPGSTEVLTWLGGGEKEVLHPSVQVGQYKMYLEDTHTAFNSENGSVGLNACTYLHNYNFYRDDIIFSDKFGEALKEFPLFTADDVEKLKNYLLARLLKGDGLDVLRKVEESKYRPSKKLMDHVSIVVKSKLKGDEVKLLGGGQGDYVLLDNQLIAHDKVLVSIKQAFRDKRKKAIIIKGGPGTGKSVIALKLLADLNEMHYNAHYATGSKSFTETLRKIVGKRASAQFKYFLSYADAEYNEIDVLICDESHRIRETTALRYRRPTGMKQIEELICAAKVGVFLIDEDQIVRPNEKGSVDLIRNFAEKHECDVFEYELDAQYRCNGSEAFVNWVNNTLSVKRTANVLWDMKEEFDFKIFDSPHELENAIRKKVDVGCTGRVTAGFCWSWSNPRNDGTLKDDVVIGDYKRPWDAKHDAKKLAPGIPRAHYWAYDPNGINQVGCIYTAQGFEFDYVGVIFGEDLVYNFDRQCWEACKENFADPEVRKSDKESLLKYLKNIYRVLLSRGIKGCYVYFMNKDTERFFKSRIEWPTDTIEKDTYIDKILTEIEEEQKYREYLPVYSLEAVATAFGKEEYVEHLGWMKANIQKKLNKDMFIAKVVGKSMEPTIPEGSYCIFRFEGGGSRNGLVVLVESRLVSDPETNQRFTIKRYKSEKENREDGSWRHKKIILSPDNGDYRDIVLENVSAEDFRIVAEFIDIVK